jgi:hypothetical protein
MFAVSSSRHGNSLLVLQTVSAWPPLGKAGGTINETTVDHALMGGLVAAGPVIRREASSV